METGMFGQFYPRVRAVKVDKTDSVTHSSCRHAYTSRTVAGFTSVEFQEQVSLLHIPPTHCCWGLSWQFSRLGIQPTGSDAKSTSENLP